MESDWAPLESTKYANSLAAVYQPVVEMVFFKPRSVADPEAGGSEIYPPKGPADEQNVL